MKQIEVQIQLVNKQDPLEDEANRVATLIHQQAEKIVCDQLVQALQNELNMDRTTAILVTDCVSRFINRYEIAAQLKHKEDL